MQIARDLRLVFWGIVVSAYMIMSYDIFKDLMKTPTDFSGIITTTVAGLGSLGVGMAVLFFLNSKKTLK